MATNGRGHILAAAMVWPWAMCGALQYLVTTKPAPDWIALVPAGMPRPHWIPADATAHLMADDDTAYTWREA